MTSDTSASSTEQAASSGTTQTAQNTGFFGANGPSFRDVLDAVNPLNHIPVVSDWLAEETGHIPSTASKLLGGAIFGPVGFAASLMNAVFEQQTGKGAVGTMVAALSSDTPATTQYAAAQSTATRATSDANTTQVAMADTTVLPVTVTSTQSTSQNQALLSLYGGSAPSAHKSYQKAQLLPYLKDVNKTQVI